MSLSDGAHGKGNALTKYLIKNSVTLKAMEAFFESGDFSLKNFLQISKGLEQDILSDYRYKMTYNIKNDLKSSLNRYRIKKGETIEISFSKNTDLEKNISDVKVKWLNKFGEASTVFNFLQTDKSGLNFTVSAFSDQIVSEKMMAIFYSGDSQIGSMAFYFGVENE
jgi:hypothetical protein